MTDLSPKFTGKASGVFHFEASDSTGYAKDWHAHDCHMLLLPRQGGLVVSTESSQPSHLSRQSFSLVPVDFAHATHAAPGRGKHMTLYVDSSYVQYQAQLNGYECFARQAQQPGVWQASEALDSILRLHDQLLDSASPEAFHRLLPHLNHLLFEECARLIASQPSQPHPSEHPQHTLLVREIQRYVQDNLTSDLTVESIGYQFHLSRRHLTRLFKAFTDETLLEFTNRTRVETAARLIATTSLSILDVSLAVGLDSPSYLARLFKRYVGVPPSELRRIR